MPDSQIVLHSQIKTNLVGYNITLKIQFLISLNLFNFLSPELLFKNTHPHVRILNMRTLKQKEEEEEQEKRLVNFRCLTSPYQQTFC